MFSEGTFDSYQNTLVVITEDIVTYGKQLSGVIGVILFFVPRSNWENKPIGSGAYIAEKLGYDFGNISMSFIAEGYLNFGYIGILIFILFMAKLVSRFDHLYWYNLFQKKYMNIMYFYFCGLLFFILRGDLLSSFAYTVGISCAVFVVIKYASK